MFVEKMVDHSRRLLMHSSGACFTADFWHELLKNNMIFGEWWEVHHGLFISYAAFAATVILYIDSSAHEIIREIKAKEKETGEDLLELLTEVVGGPIKELEAKLDPEPIKHITIRRGGTHE